MHAGGKERAANRSRQGRLSCGGFAVGLTVGTRRHAAHGQVIAGSVFLPDQGDAKQVWIKAGVDPVSEIQDDAAGSEIVCRPWVTQMAGIQGLTEEWQAVLSVRAKG